MILIYIDFDDFISPFLLNVSCDWEDISNARESVSPHFQTPRRSSKILRYASYFELSSRCLEMSSNTVFRIWYITSIYTWFYLYSSLSYLRSLFSPSISSVPDHPPSKVTAYNTSSTSVNVTWQPIPLDQRNGILLGYHVRYWRHDRENDNISIVTVNSTSLYAELDGLGKYKEYVIQVAGSTVAGLGNFSEPVFVRTEQDGE